jgi:hypothetical protein
MASEKTTRPRELVTFYDPHPGIGGATIPLPFSVKVIADGLDGKTLELKLAISLIQAVSAGLPLIELRAVRMDINFIVLSIKDGNSQHGWRVMCFR